eukprot:CAMPEP_0204375510 /NCGR_PEP_ID=MMETSP0469-20131031/49291_1 /ASSEMBLY_ACC=CAM_ASM_000384 /TAXON_ID=2969 /ORGANISM="Oxyrrhis marina" /LENGTH=137 /DNA_ID=CAMNT_0051366209 /DNA_START=149 /DNA_END=562 /DNA_ORIENTATION=+
MLFVVVYCTLFFLGKVDDNKAAARKATAILMASVQRIDLMVDTGFLTNAEVDRRVRQHLTTGEQLDLVHLMSIVLREVFQVAAVARSSSKRLYLNTADGSQRASDKRIQQLKRQLTANSQKQIEGAETIISPGLMEF